MLFKKNRRKEEESKQKLKFAATTKSVKSSPKTKKHGDSFELTSMASKSEISLTKDGDTIENILKSIQDLSKESNIFDLVYISSKNESWYLLRKQKFQ